MCRNKLQESNPEVWTAWILDSSAPLTLLSLDLDLDNDIDQLIQFLIQLIFRRNAAVGCLLRQRLSY